MALEYGECGPLVWFGSVEKTEPRVPGFQQNLVQLAVENYLKGRSGIIRAGGDRRDNDRYVTKQ